MCAKIRLRSLQGWKGVASIRTQYFLTLSQLLWIDFTLIAGPKSDIDCWTKNRRCQKLASKIATRLVSPMNNSQQRAPPGS
mmetsp:Transcript_66217/g.177324  ORF Transcript_66217/g.177324 Transcript_66217/m.177324 type:complete len:81 (-) Transcript_66217:760-1002(-)